MIRRGVEACTLSVVYCILSLAPVWFGTTCLDLTWYLLDIYPLFSVSTSPRARTWSNGTYCLLDRIVSHYTKIRHLLGYDIGGGIKYRISLGRRVDERILRARLDRQIYKYMRYA